MMPMRVDICYSVSQGASSSSGTGKDELKAIIEAFGGTVTGAVSRKTNFLVTGEVDARPVLNLTPTGRHCPRRGGGGGRTLRGRYRRFTARLSNFSTATSFRLNPYCQPGAWEAEDDCCQEHSAHGDAHAVHASLRGYSITPLL